jgi:hypothetical protein
MTRARALAGECWKVGTAAWSSIAAVIGWLTLEFVGRPFRGFLRSARQNISRLAHFGNMGRPLKGILDDEALWPGRGSSPLEDEIERWKEAQDILGNWLHKCEPSL